MKAPTTFDYNRNKPTILGQKFTDFKYGKDIDDQRINEWLKEIFDKAKTVLSVAKLNSYHGAISSGNAKVFVEFYRGRELGRISYSASINVYHDGSYRNMWLNDIDF
jgi:hypothetical protein